MEKPIAQMNNEELGKLFPIIISDTNPEWIAFFQAEKTKIENELGLANIVRIEHIGSTAIPNLKAKPTIDILLEVPLSANTSMLIEQLKKAGYQYIHRPENPTPHMMFAKGYTTQGFKGLAYHIHVRYPGDWDELYFRDYLKLNPAIAQEYEALKIQLAKQHRNDREAYTEGKTDFIKRVTEQAKGKTNQLLSG